MKTGLAAILILIIHANGFAQVTNSWSADKTGMYYSTIDTLIGVISKDGKWERLIVSEDALKNHEDLPDNISGLAVKSRPGRRKFGNLTDRDLYIVELDLQVNKDIVSVQAILLSKRKSYGYIVDYRYLPTSGTYELEKISEISVNVHSLKSNANNR